MRNFRHGCAIVAVLLIVSSFSTAFAEDDSLQDKLDTLNNQASEQQKSTDQAAAKVNTISGQLRQLQAEVDEANAVYKDVKKKLDDTQDKIDKNEILLAKTEKELAVKTKLLNKRVRDIYINGQLSYIDVLFGAADFSDFLTRMDLLKRIIKYDYDLVTKVQADKAIVMATRESLDNDKEDIKGLVKDAKDKETIVKQKKASKKKLLDKAQYDRDTSERAYQEIVAASKEVENLIRQSRYSVQVPSGGSGGMIWPINGEVTSPFGWRIHPIFGTKRFHSGIDIAGDYGDPIRAAASGTVIYAGWISGYGNAVIIDHGGGITTLYGHNEAIKVSVGQSVSQGQVIALCGATGDATGPHCHFEVRQDGEPVSPYNYL
ncbi:MAG: peptidoglycan DD-metalloendopeptidase family protein [Selenomonadaceae bacterium]